MLFSKRIWVCRHGTFRQLLEKAYANECFTHDFLSEIKHAIHSHKKWVPQGFFECLMVLAFHFAYRETISTWRGVVLTCFARQHQSYGQILLTYMAGIPNKRLLTVPNKLSSQCMVRVYRKRIIDFVSCLISCSWSFFF